MGLLCTKRETDTLTIRKMKLLSLSSTKAVTSESSLRNDKENKKSKEKKTKTTTTTLSKQLVNIDTAPQQKTIVEQETKEQPPPPTTTPNEKKSFEQSISESKPHVLQQRKESPLYRFSFMNSNKGNNSKHNYNTPRRRNLKRPLQKHPRIRAAESLTNIMMHMKSYRVKHSKHTKTWSERTLYDSSPSLVSPSTSSSSPLSPPPPLSDVTTNKNDYEYTPSSMDTKKSTPRAKSWSNRKHRKSFSRCDTEKVVNTNHNEMNDDMDDSDDDNYDQMNNKNVIGYELPPSVSFLSLILPCPDTNIEENRYKNNCHDNGISDLHDNDDEKENNAIRDFIRLEESSKLHTMKNRYSASTAPSILSVSDATTATSTTGTEDIGSIVSGQTTLAKDRLQETIASLSNIHFYLDNTANDINNPPYNNDNSNKENDVPNSCIHHDGPINVDFVLESNETEIASFVHSFIQSKQYPEAIDIYLMILDHYQKQHGHEYPFVITTLHNLSIVYVLNGNYKEATYYCKEGLKRRRRKLGDDHLDVATSLCELGIIYYAREDFNKGLDVLRQALHIVCNQHPDEEGIEIQNLDCKVASILNNIACFHYSMGKLIASIATFEESLDVMRRMIGAVSCDEVGYTLLNMSITLCNAGIVSAKHNQLDVASSLVEEGLMVQQSILPDDHRLVQSTISTLADLLHGDDDKNVEESCLPMSIQKVEIQIPKQMSDPALHRRATKSFASCVDMLTLGPVYDELNCQRRVALSAQYKYLAEAILIEGESKRHCSWVDIQKMSEDNEESNLSNVCEDAARLIRVRKISCCW